ncbi:bifunctional cobalt-precorrin-7 (C(5))-methyltransferase/cobalt-precorrin-6B (C(15))-methyltransferase [Spirulina subsalsa]|uniref:bifunctional cobalt-precorrin-7 (C(5))-methyltransferase/cobalt-precorrin-6B (C(15))-methyltransferase n=1 Tax=Spirulina subsalsa TaxID=54311 RepID=UPI0002F32487|nr:bifunctional cobalt-precorrin-7 (C(5))-methyltransferase/cobalt-precorrin-6B (C(15))-methyltransferase [Spirulina subsalsa]
MNKIQVIGIGLDGAAGLPSTLLAQIQTASLLVGSGRHLSYFPDYTGQQIVLGELDSAIAQIQTALDQEEKIVILVSGDPLFFGLGRLLLEHFPPEVLTFHPHVSAVQLAFNRVKLPWQEAQMISVHGRSLELLSAALQQGESPIAVLTDSLNTPSAIAAHYLSLDLPILYQFWVCENLGSPEEQIQLFTPELLVNQEFSPLNVLILVRETPTELALPVQQLPLLGLPDHVFLSFRDRPDLIIKREIRLSILGELALRPAQIVWDIGSGIGSVAIEIARLCPTSQVYAIEKTSIGHHLIQKNCQQLYVRNIQPIEGEAPDILRDLPAPHRVFIGGSGGQLSEILTFSQNVLRPNGVIVLAFTTLEHLSLALHHLQQSKWHYRLLQVNLSRSVAVSQYTRFAPLNPVTLVTAYRG